MDPKWIKADRQAVDAYYRKPKLVQAELPYRVGDSDPVRVIAVGIKIRLEMRRREANLARVTLEPMRGLSALSLALVLVLVACGLGDERDLFFQQGRASLDVNGVSATYTGVTGSNHVLYRPTRPGALPPALIVGLGDLRSEFFRMILDELRGPGRYVPSELTLVLRGVRYICVECQPCSVQISEASERAVAGDIACAASADGVRSVMVRGPFRLEEPTRQPFPTPVARPLALARTLG